MGKIIPTFFTSIKFLSCVNYLMVYALLGIFIALIQYIVFLSLGHMDCLYKVSFLPRFPGDFLKQNYAVIFELLTQFDGNVFW